MPQMLVDVSLVQHGSMRRGPTEAKCDSTQSAAVAGLWCVRIMALRISDGLKTQP